MIDIKKIKKELKASLSNYRYQHSLRVADEAKKLAQHYHIDEENAYLAGLVHDIAKEFKEEENQFWIKKSQLSNNSLKLEYKKNFHAEVGAIVAKEKYQLNKEICQAIQYHTIGNLNMTTLDKIVFIADKIETGKQYPGIEEERILAYQDLDKCLILCLENQKKKLATEGKKIHPISEILRKQLLNPEKK